MSGFLMGSLELETAGWIGVISIALIPLIWFTSIDSTSNPLLLLSGAEFAEAWAMPFLAVLYIVSPLGSTLRHHTGVNLQFSKLYKSALHAFSPSSITTSEQEMHKMSATHENYGATQEPITEADDTNAAQDEEGDHTKLAAAVSQSHEEESTTKELLIEGLKIMAMDVSIQLCVSLSVYLALVQDAAIGYQLTALQSALPTYGIAYARGMGIMFKVVGPMFVAKGAFQLFANLARITVVCAFLLVPLILGAVVPFADNMAFDWGENGCAYASSTECVTFFTTVFGPNATGGSSTLQYTFNAFGVGASIDAIFYVLRATLLSLVDLDYMLWCTGAAVVIYIPVIIIATLVSPFSGQAVAYFVAMYIPQFVLIILFVIRLEILIRRMLRGEDGTWSAQENRPRAISGGASTRQLQP